MAEFVSKQLLSAEGRNPPNNPSSKASLVHLLDKQQPKSSKSVAASKLNSKHQSNKTKKLSLTPSSSTSSIVSNTSTSRNTEARYNKNIPGVSSNRKRLLNILLTQNSTTEDDTEEETATTKKLKRRRRNFSSSTSSISSLLTNSTVVSSEPTIKAVVLTANSSAASSSSSNSPSPKLHEETKPVDLIAYRTRSRTQSTDRGAGVSDRSSSKKRALNYLVRGAIVTDDSEDELELNKSDQKSSVTSVDKKTSKKVQGHSKTVPSVKEPKVLTKVKQDTNFSLNSASSASSTSSEKQKVVIAKKTSTKKPRAEDSALEEELNTSRSLRSASTHWWSAKKTDPKSSSSSFSSSNTAQLPPKKRQKVIIFRVATIIIY